MFYNVFIFVQQYNYNYNRKDMKASVMTMAETKNTSKIPNNGEVKESIGKVLQELSHRLTCVKPYATLDGIYADIEGVKEFYLQLHDMPEDDKEVDVLLSELYKVKKELEHRKNVMLFWRKKQAAA